MLFVCLKGSEGIGKVKCPYCGYIMPIQYDKGAICKGVFVRCKGKNCKKIFEIKLKQVK